MSVVTIHPPFSQESMLEDACRGASAEPPPRPIDRLYGAPALILAAVAAVVFISEALVMVALSYFTSLRNPVVYLLDSTLLTALILPSLIVLVFRPIDQHLAQRRRTENALRSTTERLRSLSAHLEQAREEERTAVSREIHDELGQVLATMQLEVSSLVEYADRRQLVARVAGLERRLSGAIKTVQRISSHLRPSLLDHLGLEEALEWQAAEFRTSTGIPCTIDVLLLTEEMDIDMEVVTAVFRIFQEALTNVMRHAHASRVDASLEERNGRLVLMVADDGRGISPGKLHDGGSIGLTGMRERAYRLGGKVRICRTPRWATVVVARIPLKTRGERPWPI